MNDDSDQLITLAETLARRTRSGRAEWSETDEPGRYLYMGGNGGVTISSKPSGLMSNRGSGSQTEMNYELNIVNNKGQVVTSKQTNYPMDSGDFETPDARATLEELYKAAVGAANEADKVVKSLLTELMETEPFWTALHELIGLDATVSGTEFATDWWREIQYGLFARLDLVEKLNAICPGAVLYHRTR